MKVRTSRNKEVACATVYSTETQEAGPVSVFSGIKIVDETDEAAREIPEVSEKHEMPKLAETPEEKLAREIFGIDKVEELTDVDEASSELDELAEADEAPDDSKTEEVFSELDADEQEAPADSNLKKALKNASYMSPEERQRIDDAMKKLNAPRPLTRAELKEQELARKRAARREMEQAIAESKAGERQLEVEMRLILTKSDLDWINCEHFRLLCGMGKDEKFIYLGFRAMLRTIEQNKNGKYAGSSLAVDQYRQFIATHLTALDCLLSEPGASEKLLNADVRRNADLFRQIKRKAWPEKLMALLFSGQQVALG